jgi:hypothetical protein
MIIDGNNITTLYGLRLAALTDYYNQPARKKTLTEPSFDAKDLVYESNSPTVILFGSYTDKADLFAKISAFKTLMTGAVSHTFTHTGHNVTFAGIVTDGIRIEPFKTAVRITFQITIIE